MIVVGCVTFLGARIASAGGGRAGAPAPADGKRANPERRGGGAGGAAQAGRGAVTGSTIGLAPTLWG